MERTMVHDTKKAQTISPLAGKPAPRSSLVDLARLEREYSSASPTFPIPPSASASAPAVIGARLCADRSPRSTSLRSRKRSANTAERTESTVRCTSEGT
jgi:hypothetical protein